MLFLGIDEAGYGPLLGPLCVAIVASDYPPEQLQQLWLQHGCPIADSKRIHRSGSIAAIEHSALGVCAWASGKVPENAAALFALLGESEADRYPAPWAALAQDCPLPLQAAACCLPAQGSGQGLSGGIAQVWHLNQGRRQGLKRNQVQWQYILRGLAAWAQYPALSISCDALGGRRYYADLLQAWLPDASLSIEQEAAEQSRYHLTTRQGQERDCSFLVQAEKTNPLVAAASCVAKYAREVHMHLFNQWWCQMQDDLLPTAGYPQDARRWLQALRPSLYQAWKDSLIRI